MTELALDDNQLTTLPPEIGQLANLFSLRLGGNQLTNVPQEIGQLTRMSRLDLTGNQLTTLPQEIGQLTNISFLILNNNQLTTLPQEIVKLDPFSCDFGYNYLNPDSLSTEIITWLNEYDSDWKKTQITPIIYKTDKNHISQQFSIIPDCKTSKVTYSLPGSGKITLELLNLKGRSLSTLVDSYKQQGKYSVNFNMNESSSGVYFFKLTSGKSEMVKRIVFAK